MPNPSQSVPKKVVVDLGSTTQSELKTANENPLACKLASLPASMQAKHYIPVVPSPNSYCPSGQYLQTFQVGCKAHLPCTPSRTPPVRTRLPSLLPIGRFATVRFTAQNPKTARQPFRCGYASGTTRKRPNGLATALQRDRSPSGELLLGPHSQTHEFETPR